MRCLVVCRPANGNHPRVSSQLRRRRGRGAVERGPTGVVRRCPWRLSPLMTRTKTMNQIRMTNRFVTFSSYLT
jgi:hypothetical protein